MQYERKLKDWNRTKEAKAKFLNAFESGSTRLAQFSNLDMPHACMITWMVTWYDCAIAGYKYPVHSHFSEPLPTVNWSVSPRRNSLPLSSHHNSGIQPLFWIYSETTSKLVVAANHQHSENIQRLFRLQNCLSRKSSKSWKNSKTFLPAEMFWSQIINILEIFKDFFACGIVFAANHQ